MQLSLEDRLEILELHARHVQLADAGEHDRWAATFTPDGFFVVQPGAASYPDGIQVRGTAGLVDFRRHHFELFLVRGIRHLMTNIIVEGTTTGAKSVCYMTAMRVGDGQPPVVHFTGRFMSELAKGEYGWRFQSTTVFPDK